MQGDEREISILLGSKGQGEQFNFDLHFIHFIFIITNYCTVQDRTFIFSMCISSDWPLLQGGAAVAEWLSSWLAEQEDRGSISGIAT